MFSLEDKVVVITGGTGVLGEAFIQGVSDASGKVVIIGRNQETGEERVRLVRENGMEALFIAL